ncbi:hypothetical protein ACQR1N_08630 [Bradyrhizobium sp. HKCCYLRH1073]|uniref:hypothetical protein n=1 Tax=unclassified Bradyrhizobium TaxID=2631580 RepID=UPI0029165951|nr:MULTISPECIES: hypothetical protein [unclassified Bradyrhizobium]
MLHLREDGEPWTYEGFKTAWQREMNRPEFVRFWKKHLVFRGTRKNAVNNLIEAGCSEARVAAIVNMSPAHGPSLRQEGFAVPAWTRGYGAV